MAARRHPMPDDNARDFADIVTTRAGASIPGILEEFVTVDHALATPARKALWNPAHQTARNRGLHGFQIIQLQRRDLTMTRAKIKWI